MIVIVILGLLASFVMPNILGQSEKAKKGLVCTQMESIKNTLRMFKVDNGTYPTTEEGEIEIISLGADGTEGGKEEGADITLSQCRNK